MWAISKMFDILRQTIHNAIKRYLEFDNTKDRSKTNICYLFFKYSQGPETKFRLINLING